MSFIKTRRVFGGFRPCCWELSGRPVPAILTDLIALAEARLANVYRMYGEIINIERGLLNLAGLDEVARRLRPPKRRRTRTRKDETPPEPSPTDSPQDTGEAPSADPAP